MWHKLDTAKDPDSSPQFKCLSTLMFSPVSYDIAIDNVLSTLAVETRRERPTHLHRVEVSGHDDLMEGSRQLGG